MSTNHPLVGQIVQWTHGPNVLVGPATRYDDVDDELFIVPDGLTHGHYWVPAGECAVFEQSSSPAAQDERETILSILADMDYNDGGMMRWSSGRPTEQAEKVADRLIREVIRRTPTERPDLPSDAGYWIQQRESERDRADAAESKLARIAKVLDNDERSSVILAVIRGIIYDDKEADL